MRRDRAYWRRLTRLTVAALVATLVIMLLIVPAALGVVGMWALTHPGCASADRTPADYGHEYEDVVVVSREDGGQHRAFYVASENGAHVIFPPAFNGGRDSRLHEADVLIRQGYGALMFESRSCMGRVNTLGAREVEDVGGALDWLLARPGVDPAHIGIHGFSSAGATAIMAAARFPELRAVVAEGGYHDLGRGTLGVGGSIVEAVTRAASRLTYRAATGVDIDTVSPVAVIDRIAPRPILLIYGGREVALEGGYAQLAAAGDNAALWEVPGAGHGNYLWIAPEAYAERVTAFFEAAFFEAASIQ
ncbi:MAG: hypothetical protein M5R40_24580 [Anaerolineae bacterium]|nr:hypothetical protein [Anaerolineae bacterium]